MSPGEVGRVPTAPTGRRRYSRTIVDMVVRQKVAFLTSDAQADERFEAGESIRMQQIRSAMCVPLWESEKVIGVIHVDSPAPRRGSFTSEDLDLLTALANFAAVAIERARLHSPIDEQKRIRRRLERYHSPAVIDEIIADSDGDGRPEAGKDEGRDGALRGSRRASRRCRRDARAESDRDAVERTFFTLASDAVFAVRRDARQVHRRRGHGLLRRSDRPAGSRGRGPSPRR